MNPPTGSSRERERVEFTIRAGAGGHDSKDWASMLLRAYLCWACRTERAVEVAWAHHEWPGLLSARFRMAREDAVPVLADCGVHRLVRISPFDPQRRRHTAFAELSSEGQPPMGQIRSYTLHPTERVKDHLTDAVTPHARRVLDGEFELLEGPAS